jgi:hypothetical protein
MVIPNRRFLIIAIAATAAGCATPPRPPVVAPSNAPLAELEPLYGIEAGREALTIRVASNGCTRKDDFAVYVERAAGSASLSFGRKRLDPCKSFAMGQVALSFPYAELGVAPSTPLFLRNPLAPWTGPGS